MAILAGGRSLLASGLEALRGSARVIAVNDAWQHAPWADLLYAADWPWWAYYRPAFAGERWTQQKHSNRSITLDQIRGWGIRVVRSEERPGLSLNPDLIHRGGNSGFQALNLAVLLGAARILLVGFDMGGEHWMHDRPARFRKKPDFARFRRAFEEAAPVLGDRVINCSPASALKCFPRMTLHAALDRI